MFDLLCSQAYHKGRIPRRRFHPPPIHGRCRATPSCRRRRPMPRCHRCRATSRCRCCRPTPRCHRHRPTPRCRRRHPAPHRAGSGRATSRSAARRAALAPSDPALTPTAPPLRNHRRRASARSAEPSSSSTPTTRLDACAAALPARLPPASRTPTPAFLRRHRYVASLLYGIRSYVGSAGTSTGPLAPLCACVDSAVHTTLGSTVGGVAPSCFVPVARA
mgnify:FL=1